MTTYQDLKTFLKQQDFKTIISADAETRVHEKKGKNIVSKIPAGGVSIALDPLARALNATFIGRGKTLEDKQVVDKNNKIKIEGIDGDYTLKRVFLQESDANLYYYGFSNQTLWPLCHVAFERPEFRKDWFESYERVNKKFAQSIKEEIKGKTFIWINDYQLSLVPKFLGKPKDTTIALFWHIPWPTWEVFRILPYKKDILESLLACDFIAFHRGYQARNFLETIRRELETRIDEETNKIYFGSSITTVKSLPMGVDVDVIKSLIEEDNNGSMLIESAKNILNFKEKSGRMNEFFNKYKVILGLAKNILNVEEKSGKMNDFFSKYKVMLGVDRLDYTKGFKVRLRSIDKFLEDNPEYRGKVVYLGLISPSREKIPSYINLKKEIKELASEINKKYAKGNWIPIYLIFQTFSRKDIINFYKRANLCLVTPLDDGMNLVSKEFVIASSFAKNPGMLVLSQFAGSAIDLDSALIVNPYNIEDVAQAIKKGLEMDKKEKSERINSMVETLEEKNIYEWAREFIRSAQIAARENRR